MRIAILAAAATAALLVPAADARKPRAEATITRTTYGIPHIAAKDWRGVGFGVAYAYAEDNLCLLAEEFASVAGERSLHFGPEAKATLGFQEVDNLASDIFMRAAIDVPALRDGWAKEPEALRDLAEGYVAGYNRFLKDAGPAAIPAACRGKAWVRPITTDDMLRLIEKHMLLASSLALAPAIANAAPPGEAVAGLDPAARWRLPREGELGLGSNGWAFGGEVTASGRGMVIGNPHFPWQGPNRFWQMHVSGPDGYDAMGVGLAGAPIPFLGFNRDIAWTHTVTAARHFTLYQLALDPADPTRYMLDGASVSMERRAVSVPLPGGETITRTLYTTRFGPVVSAPQNGLVWNAASAFALSDANRGNARAIDTWMRIGKARSVAEIEAVVSETLGIPWVNTIAADRHGDALHADITAVPNVSAEKMTACATPLTGLFASLATLLDGARSDCAWDVAPGTPAPGLMPAADQASTIRRDYLANSNDSYWISNPRAPHPPLSPVLGARENPLSLRTRSNFTETDAVLAAGKLDHDRAKTLAFGNKSHAARLALDAVRALCPEAGGVAEGAVARGCGALAQWDGRFDLDSRGARLFRAFWLRIDADKDLWTVPFDPADPIATPRDLATEGEAGTKLLRVLGETVTTFEEQGLALDAPWGEEQFVTVNDERIPVHGGSHRLGVLNMMEAERGPDGQFVPRHGTSYIQIVGFDEDGPVADAILSYSQSTDPASPHVADQTRAYAAKQWHRLPFTAQAIREQAIGKPRRIAE